MVERHLAKVNVASSNLVFRSNKKPLLSTMTIEVFFNDIRSLRSRMIYASHMIYPAGMIYACGCIWNGYYIMLGAKRRVYHAVRQRSISYGEAVYH